MNKKDLNSLNTYLTETLVGNQITAVNVLVLDDKEPMVNDDGWLLSDAGIELTFSNDKKLTFCYDAEYEVNDIFSEKILDVCDFEKQQLFDESDQDIWKPYMKQKIANFSVDWNWYMSLEDEQFYMPLKIDLQFENGEKLSLASIEFEEINDDELTIFPDSEGAVMVVFNNELADVLAEGVANLEENDEEE